MWFRLQMSTSSSMRLLYAFSVIGHGSPFAQLATSMVTARLSLLLLDVHQLAYPSSTYMPMRPSLPMP